MLSELYIENVAVIEKLSIDFDGGFNVFTGETGAGKSIIIDAVNAVTGHRASKELIRTGTDRAFISAAFYGISPENLENIRKIGYDTDENGCLILQRAIYSNGRNSCKINGVPVNVSALRDVSEGLLTIHGQHETYELFSDDTYINYLDKYADNGGILNEYRLAFSEFKKAEKIYKKTQAGQGENERQIDMLRYQIDELERADLADGETEALESRKAVLMNAEKINQNIFTSLSLLKGDDDTSGALALISQAADAMGELAELDSAFSEISSRLNSIYYELEDCSNEIASNQGAVEFDQNELYAIDDRLELIHRLEKKYGREISDMLEFLKNARQQLSEIENIEFNHEKIYEDYKLAVKNLKTAGEKLTKSRLASAEKFIRDVKNELKFLDMPKITLDFKITSGTYSEKGKDKVEMLISTNPGEALRPISKIASGGELSRIMLAIKSVLADKDIIETLIFDEIDTGISGSASQKVGIKLKNISSVRQVVCITHQAQLAAIADSHYFIKKSIVNDRSFTAVNKLNFEERKKELARIIGGAKITDATLKLAEEMLDKEKNYGGIL